MVHNLTRCKHQRHRKLSFNVFMENFFTTQPLQAELHLMGIGACGICRQQFRVFPKELMVGKNVKLPYYVLLMFGLQPCYGWTVRLLP